MRCVKRTPYTVKTRTRYARLCFSDDPNDRGNVLKAAVVNQCECGKDGIRPLPEWAPVTNKNGAQYKCNISNALEIGSRKVEDEYTDGYEDVYYALSRTGIFYMYVEEMNAFQTVVTGRKRMVVCPLMKDGTAQFALFTTHGFVLVNADTTYNVIIEKDTVAAGAYFRHRVFVGMKNGILKYSAPEDFTNFTESVEGGGSIRLPDGGGEIIAIKVFDDALYVFFQSGIIRLNVGGDPCEFYAEKIPYSGGDIFARTVCVCDHVIYFLTVNGVYRLQGKKAERLELGMTFPLKEGSMEGCAVWRGMPMMRYYDTDNKYKTIMIRPDGTAFFIPDLIGLSSGDNGKVLFADSQRNIYHLVDDGQGSVWFTGNVETLKNNLGYVGRKCLRKLCFYGEGSCTVTLKTEGKSFTKTFTFENGFAEWFLHALGEYYTFSFTIERGSKIREVYAEFEVLTRYKEVKNDD